MNNTNTPYQLLTDAQLEQAQRELNTIKRYFKDHTPITVSFSYNARAPIGLTLWEKGEYNHGGLIKTYSGGDKQVFWMYDKIIEEGLYPATKEQQEKDMGEFMIEILSDSNKEIALRTAPTKLVLSEQVRYLD
jgi:hypothetical protein